MLQFAEQFIDNSIVVTLSQRLSWLHFLVLIPLKTIDAKLFYAQTTENEPVIVINKYADAIYNLKEGTLYFKSLTLVSTIFKGIEELYREATEKETEKFLENDFIVVGDTYSADKVKKANRKRIAMGKDWERNFKD